jgi:hypothetical protein
MNHRYISNYSQNIRVYSKIGPIFGAVSLFLERIWSGTHPCCHQLAGLPTKLGYYPPSGGLLGGAESPWISIMQGSCTLPPGTVAPVLWHAQWLTVN